MDLFPVTTGTSWLFKKENVESKMLNAEKDFFVTRIGENALPAVPLPFYPISTGISIYKRGHGEQVGGILNQFVRIAWLLSGTYETVLLDKKRILGKNAVWYTLYGEERLGRVISGECRIRWLAFDGPLAESVMLSFRYPRVQVASEYPAELFEELDEIMSEVSPEMIRRKTCLVMEILASMAEKEESLYSMERLVPKCLALIRGSLSDPDFGLETLCERFSVSRATLSRLFRKETHFSPGRFILNEKMAREVALLSGTDLTIDKVAKQCGFRDRPTFTRFMKRAKGMSPSEFREKYLMKTSE